jgi:hypothetical protein
MRWVSPLLLLATVSACGARSALYDKADAAALPDLPPPPDLPLPPDRPSPPPDRPSPPPDLPPPPDRPSPPPDRPSPPPDVPARVTAVCPPSQRAVETQTVILRGGGTHSRGEPLTVRWTVESQPGPTATSPLSDPRAAQTSLALPLAGTWRVRLTVSDAAGRSDSCTTAVEADPAIDLVCPADQSRYQSDLAELVARATSRLGRGLSYQWSVTRRPAGSAANPSPAAGSLTTRLPCDALGDYTVELAARDDAGLSRRCTANVHVDPDVLVTCPADVTSVPFSTVALAGRAMSRLGLPLTYRWTTERRPTTSTAELTNATAPTAGFTFDVAGDWVWRLTASNNRGNSASCTTRAFSRGDEAVRVELVWNLDRSCRSCNPQGGGIDIDLHLTDVARSDGRWAAAAPENSDCYYANCRCDRGVGMLCPSGVLQWPPVGDLNNPQLDVDHVSDLPGPENINVTRAAPGTRFAVGVHYFSGSEPTPTVVRVYCGGVLVFESERVTLSGTGGAASDNALWRVGEILVGGDGRACAFTRCGRAGAVSECIRPENAW